MSRVTAVLLMVLACACARDLPGAGPSPVQAAGPRIVAVVIGDGVRLKAEGLQSAQQVEGFLEWVPRQLGYESFDLGQWWFSTTDWEWVIVPKPNEGRMFWGVWRQEALSGDGTLGLIRFRGTPSLESLRVWVDGRSVDAVTQDERGRPGAGADGLRPAAGPFGGVLGVSGAHRWFVLDPGSPR